MLRIAGIESDSIVDGEGWRYVIFVQGCKHACPNCHNQQTWDMDGGTEISVEELIEKASSEIETNILSDGVTISGGDPFYQCEEVEILCRELKKKDINIWVYTGFTYEHLLNEPDMKRILEYIDVLVDGPFIEAKKTLEAKYKGSSNQRIIDVQKSLRTGTVELLNLN